MVSSLWLHPSIIIIFISSDRSSYSDSGLLYINVRKGHFLKFWAFLPIYLVFLFANWMKIDNNWPWTSFYLLFSLFLSFSLYFSLFSLFSLSISLFYLSFISLLLSFSLFFLLFSCYNRLLAQSLSRPLRQTADSDLSWERAWRLVVGVMLLIGLLNQPGDTHLHIVYCL